MACGRLSWMMLTVLTLNSHTSTLILSQLHTGGSISSLRPVSPCLVPKHPENQYHPVGTAGEEGRDALHSVSPATSLFPFCVA